MCVDRNGLQCAQGIRTRLKNESFPFYSEQQWVLSWLGIYWIKRLKSTNENESCSLDTSSSSSPFDKTEAWPHSCVSRSSKETCNSESESHSLNPAVRRGGQTETWHRIRSDPRCCNWTRSISFNVNPFAFEIGLTHPLLESDTAKRYTV